MIIIEIPPNPNCETVEMRVFHEAGPARQVTHVRLERVPGQLHWYEVTGWTVAGIPCSARAQKVDDSGEGTAFLIYGGDAGLRFRPEGSQPTWQLSDPQQWGESLLIITDINELKLSNEKLKNT